VARWLQVDRFAPILAGLAGLAWFWAELAPQRAGFPDTDDPAVGLQFITAHPQAWPLAGLALGVAAVALVATALVMRARIVDSADDDKPRGVTVDTVTAVGLFASAMLFGMAAVRMSGGPARYVQGLDQAWGEAAYLVTQFVGIQALVTGGFVLLELWLMGIAWLGARCGVIPRAVAVFAVLPAFRLVGVLGPFGIQADGLWPVVILAIPATFVWLMVLGATIRPSPRMSTGDTIAPSSAARQRGGEHLGEASA
jgi:hypothetical protein